MEDNKNLLAAGVVTVAVIALAIALTLSGRPSVNVSVSPSGQPVVVAGGQMSSDKSDKFGAYAPVPSATTVFTSVEITDDLTVKDAMSVAGTVSSTSLEKTVTQPYTASASSQAFCSVQNTTGRDAILDSVSLVYATSTATGGLYRFTISNTSAAATTGTGAALLYDNSFAPPTNGIKNITTTSTLEGTGGLKQLWYSGQYVNFLVASPTTTAAGFCSVVYR